MGVLIRSYQMKDEEQLNQLQQLTYKNDDIIPMIHSEKAKHAYSLVDGDLLLGVIVAWKSSFHPFCTYFRIITDPASKIIEYGNLLLMQLESDLAKDDYPLQVACWETSSYLSDLFKRNGFQAIRKTYIPSVEMVQLKTNTTRDPSIFPLSVIIKRESLWREFVLLVKENYENTHKTNPVGIFPFDTWEKLILEDIICKGSYVKLGNEKIIAYSLLHKTENENTVELGWCGGQTVHNRAFIKDIVAQQIDYAIKEGYTYMEGEFDTTSIFAQEVYQNFPFPPSVAWVTYQKEARSSS